MTTNIQQMEENIEKMRRDYRMEGWRIFFQGIVATAAVFAAGAAVMNYLDHHSTAPATADHGKP